MTLALGRHLLESTVFALTVGLLTLCFQKRGARARHAMWFIAAAKFALPVALFSGLGASLHSFFPSTRLSVIVPEGLARLLTSRMSPPLAMPGSSGLFNPLILIWLAGGLAMLAAWLPKLFASVHSLKLRGDLDEDSFLRLRQRIGLRRDVKLRFSDSQVEPVLSGFWRPIVIIPNGISLRLSSAELEAVILHELAHAKRWDNWTGAFVHALTCVFWFYPLLWWVERRLNCERELACDEMVVQYGAAPEDYVAGILKVCRFHLSEGIAGVSGVSRSNLKNRMEVIMSLSSSAPVPQIPKALVGTLIAIMTVVPMTIGLMAVPNLHGQAAKGSKKALNQMNLQSQLSCVFNGVEYPEGTVIQMEGGPEQMCARVLNSGPDLGYRAQWIHTSKTIRERSRNIVHLPQLPPFVCTPKSSTLENFCSCEGSSPFSQDTVLNSANGRLRCDQGKWVSIENPHVEKK